MFRALVVNSSVTTSNLTGRAIKDLKFGARVNYALSAAQALYYLAGLRDDPRRTYPDIVVLDADLPDAKGTTALKAMLKTVGDHPLAVVMVCPPGSESSAYYQCGAEAVVPRSPDPQEHMQEIGETVCFVAMILGLIPKQTRFLPPQQQPHIPSISDILQIHL